MRCISLLCTSVVLLLLLCMCSAPSHAQSIELYGAYSFVRAPVTFTQTILCPVPGCPSSSNTHTLNMNGWEAGAAGEIHWPAQLESGFQWDKRFLQRSKHASANLFGRSAASRSGSHLAIWTLSCWRGA
jgi:hypothetical protein